MSQFVHLHLHTQYSVLDGANKIKEVVKKAAEYKQQAIGMTDHGNMHGAVEFYQECKANQIKPIIGCEVYVTPGSRFDRVMKSRGGDGTNHLTLLAMNYEGYQNLSRLVTLAYKEGFYFKPRVDHELLRRYNKGIICLSGCLAGELGRFALSDDFEAAKNIVEMYSSIFKDRYYLELQPHQIPEQQKLNKLAKELAKDVGLPLVATNDCHYINEDDHFAQEVLMCISTAKLITDPTRIQHVGVKLHFREESEMMREMLGSEEAVKQTYEIANRCNLEFDFNTYYMPKFEVHEETLDEHFERVAREMLRSWLATRDISNGITEDVYWSRLEEEIKLIIQMGFAGYFLVVSDFILYAKSNDIPVGPGRGSAAGSLVAFAMSITEIDPIEHKLLFERFLNPERISLPDIDIDFCIYGRDKVIKYVTEKYGEDKVAQICTFGTLKAKAAIRDVGRVLGMSFAETDRIAKLIPAPRQGFDYPLIEAIKMEKKLKEYAEGEGKQLIDLALKLEGLARHTSTHAAGIVIADRPVVDILPLMLDKDNQVVTQYSMGAVEKMGLVKFDFLGLKTLTVIHDALKLIEKTTGKKINFRNLPLNDPKAFSLLARGRTIGIFQLESSGITDMLRRMKPTSFDDIVAILALYRPGPLDSGMADRYIDRKNNREPIKYLHPMLKDVLSDTYGIILYQEQIMQIARDLAGYSLGEADLLRRAMGKKKPEEMAKQREKFTEGAVAKGIGRSVATEIFDQMETFARYGFNRSHSAAYAMISYQTAYLKAHYPVCFMAALMTHEMGDTDKTLKNLNECNELKIEVLPPDVNSGGIGFNVEGKKIIFGLAAIKGVGEKAVEKIIEERESAKGSYQNYHDFLTRVDQSVLNKKTMESLIKGGAFDFCNKPRSQLLDNLELTFTWMDRVRTNLNSNQLSLFGGSNGIEENDEPDFLKGDYPEWPSNIKLNFERDALGFYLTGHPLERFSDDLPRIGAVTISEVKKQSDGAQVNTAGVITALKLKNTKKGDRYASFIFEDLLETIEVLVWPDVYNKTVTHLSSQDPVLLTARLDVTEERSVLVANNIEPLSAIRDKSAREAIIKVSSKVCTPINIEKLKIILNEYKGDCPVKLVIRKDDMAEVIINLSEEYKVNPSDELYNKIETVLSGSQISFL